MRLSQWLSSKKFQSFFAQKKIKLRTVCALDNTHNQKASKLCSNSKSHEKVEKEKVKRFSVSECERERERERERDVQQQW